MKKKDSLQQAFAALDEKDTLTASQKQLMLAHITAHEELPQKSATGRLRTLVTEYPWRFAFGVSIIQTLLCTAFFGKAYTNIFLSIFGG